MTTIAMEQNKNTMELNKTITRHQNFITGTIQKISKKFAALEREQAMREADKPDFFEDAGFLYRNE